jgi:hypothetical protein
MTYTTKFRIINYLLPVLVVLFFAKVGISATHELFAQTPPTNLVTMSLPQTQYTVGQDVIATLSNTSNKNVFVINNCPDEPLDVSKLVNGAWTTIYQSTNVSKCAGEPSDYEIPANRSVPVDYRYWQTMFDQAGTYRIHAAIEPSTQGPTIDFTVIQ